MLSSDRFGSTLCMCACTNCTLIQKVQRTRSSAAGLFLVDPSKLQLAGFPAFGRTGITQCESETLVPPADFTNFLLFMCMGTHAIHWTVGNKLKKTNGQSKIS